MDTAKKRDVQYASGVADRCIRSIFGYEMLTWNATPISRSTMNYQHVRTMHLTDRTKIAKDAKQERMFVECIEQLLLPDKKAPQHKYPGSRGTGATSWWCAVAVAAT